MIRKLRKEEITAALNLVKNVYYKTEYINDTEEGRRTFEKEFLLDSNIPIDNEFYGYFIENQMIGIVGFQDNAYIKYLFIDMSYEHKGIGTELLTFVFEMLKKRGHAQATLDSTVYGYEFYLKMGLIATSDKIVASGMSYIPMIKIL